MKKFIFLTIFSVLMMSCSVYNAYEVITYGDISILDDNGNEIRHYENSVVEYEIHSVEYNKTLDASNDRVSDHFHAIKNNGGLNFIDNDNVSHYVIGGIIIIDNIKTIDNGNEVVNAMRDNGKSVKVAEYHNILEEYEYYTKEIKKYKKDSREYKELKEVVDRLEVQKKEMEKFLWKKYKYTERQTY